MNGFWRLNGNDLYTTYGVVLLRGTNREVLTPPAIKRRSEYNFQDSNGVVVDKTSPVSYEARRYALPIVIVASDKSTFWQKYNSLIGELAKPGEFTLYIKEIGVTLNLLYEGMSVKSSMFKSDKITVEYDLHVLEADPTSRVYGE